MTPRFERRRPGGEEDGDRSGPPPRGGKPSRFSAPRRDWRGASSEREGRDNDRRTGGEGRPARVIPARPPGRRPDAGDRPSGGKPAYGKPSFAKPAYGKPASGKPSYGKPSFGKPSFGKPAYGKPAYGKPSFGARPAFGDRPSNGPRPSAGGRPSFGERGRDRPSFGKPPYRGKASVGDQPPFERSRFGAGADRDRDRDRQEVPEPSGESDRFGAEPAEDMIWGRHPALAALEADRPIHRIWCTPELRFAPRFLQLLREAKAGGVLVEEVTWARLGQLTGGAVHQGIVLQAAAAETLDLGTLIEGCRGLGEPPLLMAVDGLTDPHNLGAIVRSAEALGAHGLVLPQRRNAGLTGSVAKVAAGALEHLPVAKVVNLNRSLEQLKDEGYRVVGLAEEGTVSLIEADLDGPLVVVTGSESQGLSMLTRKHCDQLVRIPLRGATPSLNASVATALLVYEVARRGWMKSISGAAPAPRLVRPQLPSQAAAADAAAAAATTTATAVVATEPDPGLHSDPDPDPVEASASAAQALAESGVSFPSPIPAEAPGLFEPDQPLPPGPQGGGTPGAVTATETDALAETDAIESTETQPEPGPEPGTAIANGAIAPVEPMHLNQEAPGFDLETHAAQEPRPDAPITPDQPPGEDQDTSLRFEAVPGFGAGSDQAMVTSGAPPSSFEGDIQL